MVSGVGMKRMSDTVFVSRVVLIHTYITMDGLHWDQSDMWRLTLDVCEWYGVGCLFVDVFHELRLP